MLTVDGGNCISDLKCCDLTSYSIYDTDRGNAQHRPQMKHNAIETSPRYRRDRNDV
jgi:hypothetical protein